jgi:hypothetical protein
LEERERVVAERGSRETEGRVLRNEELGWRERVLRELREEKRRKRKNRAKDAIWSTKGGEYRGRRCKERKRRELEEKKKRQRRDK